MRRTPRGLALLALAGALGGACSQSPAPQDSANNDATLDATLEASVDASVESAVDATASDALRPPPIPRTMSEAVLAQRRRACQFNAGAWPAETLGAEVPLGEDIPINHVIVLMQENRSWDHYFGRLVAQGYYQAGDFSSTPDGGVGSGYAHPEQVDVPPSDWSQPDSDGSRVAPFPDTQQCYDANHSWNAMHAHYNNGRMDGFVTENNPDGRRVMSYQDDTTLPFYYALANEFALGDRYFAPVLSSTWPNRLFAMAGTSFGIGNNSFVDIDQAEHPVNHIFSLLDQGRHTWRDYTDGPHQLQFFLNYGFRSSTIARFRNVRCDLYRDIQNNTLPDVAFVMGNQVSGTNDEGGPNLPAIGSEWIERVVRALFASQAWRDTVLFITYDENGGMADHVRPADACPPDNYAPHNPETGQPFSGDFRTTGFRVPFLVISPYARRHFVSHVTYDHTSILRFIEARFGLPALTARDANATPPMELFDFTSAPHRDPPTLTAHTSVPQSLLDRCHQSLAPMGCPDQ